MSKVVRRWKVMKWALAVLSFVVLCRLLLAVAERNGGEALPGIHGATVEVAQVSFTSVEDAASSAPGNWSQWDGKGYLKSGRGETRWLRITLVNPSPAQVDGILTDEAFYLDHATCHLSAGNGGAPWKTLRSGEWVSPLEKPLWGKEAAFPVTLAAGESRVVYLELRDFFGARLRPVWWEDATRFHSARLRFALAEGGYFGAVLGLLLYNASLWSGSRFPGIGFYLLRLICFFGSILLARGELLMVGVVIGSPWMEIFSIALLALGGWFLLRFAGIFVPLPEEARITHALERWAGRALLILAAACLGARWISWAYWLPLVFLAVVCVHFVVPWVVIVSVRSGRALRGFDLLAAGLLFGGMLPLCTLVLPLVPLESGGIVIMAGSILETVLLSLLIASRYAALQQERIQVQAQLLEEAEQRKVIQETYLDELALEVGERTKELRVSLDDKDRMLALLGHDLRSPLTGLTRRAEQLSSSGNSQELKRFTGEVASMGGKLLLLIEDLVLWGKLRAGSVHLSRFPVRVLVEPVAALHAGLAVERGISLHVDLPSRATLHTDVVLGQTLLRNILSNAIRFAESRVVVAAEDVPEGVRISVVDDGPGLPDIPFEKLNQSGLGLQLCREIVAALSGRLEVGAVPGGGTIISFVLATAESLD